MNRFGSVCVIVLALVGSICVPSLSPAAAPAPQQAPSGEAVFPRDYGPAIAAAEDIETNLCTEQLVMGDPQASPSWNGWGNGPANTRFQPKAQGKLTAADLPRLQLKWAFGFSNAMTARPQPTVVGGRLFAPSENGHVYALNPHTGCRYWTYKAQALPAAVSRRSTPAPAISFGEPTLCARARRVRLARMASPPTDRLTAISGRYQQSTASDGSFTWPRETTLWTQRVPLRTLFLR